MRGFDQVEDWIFDLDNTLYPARCRLFDQVDRRMGEFISTMFRVDRAEARRIQKDYFFRYGTTLRGLMIEHRLQPDDFLDYVHDIDHTAIEADTRLSRAMERLPGRRFIFTNGTVAHAERVLARVGITARFDDIFDIKASDYLPKPERGPYEALVAKSSIRAERAAMFEDIARNLEVPHELGMTTVLVTCEHNEDSALVSRRAGDAGRHRHVHHVTGDLGAFLDGLVPERVDS